MRNKILICLLILPTFLLSCFTTHAAETGMIGDAELGSRIAKFYKGSISTFSSVTKVSNSSGVSYTTVSTRSGRESYADFGNIQAVSRCRFPDETVYRYIGLTNETPGQMKVKFKLKLDDIRNKNLKVVFSYAQDAAGTTALSPNFINDDYRYVFCGEDGNEYISIGDAVAETTEWQTVEAAIDLSSFSKVKNKGMLTDADWSKAAAIEIASLKTDNVFAVDSTVSSMEISYEQLELEYSAYNYCNMTIDVTDSGDNSITSLSSSATIVPKVTFENKKLNDETVLVMFAVYKNDLMVELMPKFITATSNTTDEIALGTYTLPSDVTGYEVFMYLWSDFHDMQALSSQLWIK